MSSDPLVMKLIEENKALTLRLDECLKAMQAALAENERIQLAGELGAKSAYRVVKHLLAPLGVVEVASAVERQEQKCGAVMPAYDGTLTCEREAGHQDKPPDQNMHWCGAYAWPAE